MDDFQSLQKPERPPEGGGGEHLKNPVRVRVDYRAGKTTGGYVAKATPAESQAHFHFWHRGDEITPAQKVEMPELTIYVLGVFATVEGAFQTQSGNFKKYFSNYVRDTRTDFVSVSEFVKGEKPNHIVTGIYQKEVKEHLEKIGVNSPVLKQVKYQNILVCYCKELDCIIDLAVSNLIEKGLSDAIAAATGQKCKGGFLYGLCAMATETWAFKFSGQFQKVAFDKNKAVVNYEKGGECFFQPVFECAVLRSDNPRQLEFQEMANEVGEFVDYQQSWAAKRVEKRDEWLAERAAEKQERGMTETPEFVQRAANATQPTPANVRPSAAANSMFPDSEPPMKDQPATNFNEADDLPF